MPMEKFCSSAMDEEIISSFDGRRDTICEFSRLGVDRAFRRRPGERASRFGELSLFDCTQPLSVAEVFTGVEGKYVPIRDTVRGFQEILNGDHDDLPEQAFYMVGTIEEAVEKAESMRAEG